MATPTDDDRTLLTVIAHMQALPGKEDDLRAALEDLVDPTLAEDGCVTYDLHQGVEDPSWFFFYENWASAEKLQAHLENDHLVAFANRLDEFLVGGSDGLVITQLRRVR